MVRHEYNYNNDEWLTSYETALKYHRRDDDGDKKNHRGHCILTRMPVRMPVRMPAVILWVGPLLYSSLADCFASLFIDKKSKLFSLVNNSRTTPAFTFSNSITSRLLNSYVYDTKNDDDDDDDDDLIKIDWLMLLSSPKSSLFLILNSSAHMLLSHNS